VAADAKCFALDPVTGDTRWVYGAAQQITAPALGADGTVYIGASQVGANHGLVLALDGATGAKKWEFATRDYVADPVAVAVDGTVFVPCRYYLYALDGATGAKRWEVYDFLAIFSAPSIGSDGTLYVGAGRYISPSDHSRVYAFNPATGGKKWDFAITTPSGPPALGADGGVYIGSGNGGFWAVR
jgi:outer membrane protein assembly factor BamB